MLCDAARSQGKGKGAKEYIFLYIIYTIYSVSQPTEVQFTPRQGRNALRPYTCTSPRWELLYKDFSP
jgi:hypothetical protein